MDREKIRELLRRRPFQPFRVCLANGQTHDVLLPNMHILAQNHMTIGFPEPNMPDPWCNHKVIVMLSDITRVEMLPAAADSPAPAGS